MNTSNMPLSLKSSSVVSSVVLATGCAPRAASTASAVVSMVPPTQKPRALMLWSVPRLPTMSCVTPMAWITASSM